MISTLMQGKCFKILRAVAHKNGFEAWMQVSMELEAREARRRLALLSDILHPRLDEQDEVRFVEQLLQWEHDVENYKKTTKKTSTMT